jgi:uncharacterized membrane protein
VAGAPAGLTTPARAEAFSDGVFAIAVTLLVLDLHVPVVRHELLQALVSEWPSYAAYVVSFATIGIIWVNHHSLFDRLRRVDRPLLFLNLLLLLTVSVLPFPTSVFARYLDQPEAGPAAAFYCGSMVLLGIAFGAVLVYASRRPGLLTEEAAQAIDGRYIFRFTIGGPIYALAMLVALVEARTALAICGALAVYYALLPAPGQPRGHHD